MPIQFIYFDLDDTLLDHRRAERRALADVCLHFEDHFGAFPPDHVQETYHRHNVVLWHRYAQGEIGQADLKRLRFEQLLEALAVEGLEPERLSDHYLECYARHWHFDEAARAAFLAVAERYPVGILTNGFADVQHAKLGRFPEIRDRLAALVVSETVGYLKPHPALFAHATAQAGVPPRSILYVGDSYTSDVQGALRAGWQSAWYTLSPDAAAPEGDAPEAYFRFTDWDALLHHLGVHSPSLLSR